MNQPADASGQVRGDKLVNIEMAIYVGTPGTYKSSLRLAFVG